MNINTHDDNASHLAQWHPLLMLSAAVGELEPAQQGRLASHFRVCALGTAVSCSEKEKLALFTSHRSEPDAAMLASFRAGLDDTLDREEERGWLRRTLGLRMPLNWLAPRPGWRGGVLLIGGFHVGGF